MIELHRKVKSVGQWFFVVLSFIIFFFFVLLPLTSMFTFAFQKGFGGFFSSIFSPEAIKAFQNSIFIAIITTVVNIFVGTFIAFTITRYRFPGHQIFRALIDMPIAIPAAVVGLALMMLYGPIGLLGPIMKQSGIQISIVLMECNKIHEI